MNTRQQRIMIIGLVIVAILAFGTGTLTGMAYHRGTFLNAVARVAQLTSGVFDPHKDYNIPTANNLDALEVIWEVRKKVLNNFVFPIKDPKKLTYGAIRGMLASLHDPYTRFLEPADYKDFETDTSGHFDGIGAVLEAKADAKTGHTDVIISQILPEGPAAKTNLHPQDVILKVDNTNVEGMTLNDVVKLIRGPRGTPVVLTVNREGSDKPIPITVVRANIEVKVVDYRMLDQKDKIGYIWLRQFNENAETEMQTAINDLTRQGMKGLVFDLSMDPGGILDVARQVASLFISSGPVVWIQNRGEAPQPMYAIPGRAISKKIPMVTLIDGGSASASEIVSGALQDTGRSLIVGQHSFGKSEVQTIIELQDHSAMFLSTAIYLTPKKRNIGLKDAKGNPGVKPDVYFPAPAPNSNVKFTDWHNGQVKMAEQALMKRMVAKAK